MWIDSHCHLNNEKLSASYGSADSCIQSARAAKISGMLSISSMVRSEFPAILEIARHYPDVWCTVGTHPHEASQPDEKNANLTIVKLP